MRALLSLCRLLGFTLLCVVASGAAAAPVPAPARGAIDLSTWNFQDDGQVSLGGQWSFYSGRWANEIDGAIPVGGELPGAWDDSGHVGHGFGTYTLKLVLPAAPEGERFAILTGYIYSAYRVYANGELIATSGQPSTTAAGESARAYHRLALLPANAREVELRYEVSNHIRRSGGAFTAPVLGLESELAWQRDLYLALSYLLVGGMLSAAAYHFLVFALSPATRTSFWFALFASVLAIRTFLIEPLAGNAVPVIGQDWVWRIDFAATVLLMPTAYQFFCLAFPEFVSKRYAPPLAWFSCAGAFVSIVFGAEAGHLAVNASRFVSPILLVYLVLAIGRAAWQRTPGAQLAFIGWVFSAFTVAHDYMLDLHLIKSISLIPFGFTGVLLCLSGTLAARHSDAYRRTWQFSREMATRNEDLEAAVAERTCELSRKIDELNASQTALEQARKDAVSANVAKSRFLATMSHELRTPLNSILGFADIIRNETMGPVGDDRYREYASHIHDSGSHLLSLICDVLDISKIEAGKMELHPEPLDIVELCETALRHAATRDRYAADAVSTAFDAKLPLVNADQRAVIQMVINLLSNALKFTPAGGKITLAARRREDGGISVEVADSGVGMEEADIPKALTLFSQVDDGHARKHEGTGLGLPIVKALIELHGGTLSLMSEKGKGTTVRIDFPASATVKSAEAA